MDTRLLRPWDFLGKSTGVGCHFLLQGTSQPRNRTQVSHIVDRHFTIWATREVTWHAAIHGVEKSWTRLSNWTELYNPQPQSPYHHHQEHVPSVVYHRFWLPTFGSWSSAYLQDSSSLMCLCLGIHTSRPANQHMFLPSSSLHLGLPWCNQPYLYFLSVFTIVFLRVLIKNPLWVDFGITEFLICPVLIMLTVSHRQTVILIKDKQ